MAQFFFQDVSFEHYKGLGGLALKKLKRINIVGGLNSAGKTSLLEAIFMIVDGGGFQAAMRQHQWRNLPPSVEAFARIIFPNGQMDQVPARLSAKSRAGDIAVEIRYEPQAAHFALAVPAQVISQSTANPNGITIRTTVNRTLRSAIHFRDNGAGTMDIYQENHPGVATTVMAPGVFLSRRTIDLPNDLAARYSLAVETGKKKLALKLAQMIDPNIESLDLLQLSGQSILCANMQGNDRPVPVSFAGDGVTAVLSAGLAILQAPKGCILLDEWDAGIHFSMHTRVFEALFALAKELEVQVFLATHSREAIESAAAAAENLGYQQDMQYLRLNKRAGKTSATAYKFSELADALASEWEVR